MNNAIGVTLSAQDAKVDFKSLAKDVDFVCLKLGGSETTELKSDPNFATRVQVAYDAGLPVGAMWTVGPGYWLARQYTIPGVYNLKDSEHPILKYLVDNLKNKAISFLAFEVHDISLYTPGGQVTDTWLAVYLRDIIERLIRQQNNKVLKPFKIGVFSRESFIRKYPELNAYLSTQRDVFIWTAYWTNMGGGTLSRFIELPTDVNPTPFSWCPDRKKEWHFWNFVGDGKVRYTTSAVKDYNDILRPLYLSVFNGDVPSLRDWLGIQSTVPTPPPTTPPTVPDDINAKLDYIISILDKLSWLGRDK